MSTGRARTMAVALAGCAAIASCASPRPAGRVMTYPEYRAVQHETPYVLVGTIGDSRLFYYGAAHFGDPNDPQAIDIEWNWDRWKPDIAFNEGGDPPVALTREEAIGRYSEAGLLRWLAHRDGVPIRSLDPTKEQEAHELLKSFSAEDLKVFYVLRAVMQDARRATEYREASIEDAVQRWLDLFSRIDSLGGAPRTLAEFEQAVRRRAPELADWRTVPPEWFDPAMDHPPAFTNSIARKESEYRDRFIVETLVDALRRHRRVFATVGASHVVMQRPALEARLDQLTGAGGYAWDDPAIYLSRDALAQRGQVRSLSGRLLEPPEIAPEQRQELERELGEAFARAHASNPSEDDFVWLGRRLGYMYRFDEAIEVFTRGLERFPDSPTLLRHRGHRYITVRRFDLAAADLERAAQLIRKPGLPDTVEPDGQPNRFDVPRSTLHTNIYYHLGLAYYLRGDFERAVQAYRRYLSICHNDDMRVATSYWLYMALRRVGMRDEADAVLAPISPEMEIMENDAYQRLCLYFKGLLPREKVPPSDQTDAAGLASVQYGLASWDWCEGRRAAATRELEMVAASPAWVSFGVIAAEADVARLRQGAGPSGDGAR